MGCVVTLPAWTVCSAAMKIESCWVGVAGMGFWCGAPGAEALRPKVANSRKMKLCCQLYMFLWGCVSVQYLLWNYDLICCLPLIGIYERTTQPLHFDLPLRCTDSGATWGVSASSSVHFVWASATCLGVLSGSRDPPPFFWGFLGLWELSVHVCNLIIPTTMGTTLLRRLGTACASDASHSSWSMRYVHLILWFDSLQIDSFLAS